MFIPFLIRHLPPVPRWNDFVTARPQSRFQPARLLFSFTQCRVIGRVLHIVPGQTGFDQRQIDQRAVVADVTDGAFVRVLIVLHDASSLPTNRLSQKFSRIVPERLATFRAVDAVEPDPDGLIVIGQHVDRVAWAASIMLVKLGNYY